MNLRALAAITLLAAPAVAWDADGHRMVTAVALDGMSRRLGADAPDFLRDRHTLEMIADGATTPDRWRSTKTAQLTHLNYPDHYLDLEELPMYGMTLATMPRLRHEFVRQLSLAREKTGFTGPPINEKLDPNHTREYPGFLPHAAAENYGKLVSAFSTIRSLEKLNDPARSAQLDMARATAYVHMGILAHYIGDAAQPLHTTTHHHGWIGDNPRGYTTDRGIHAYIDGTIVDYHKLTVDSLRPLMKYDIKLDAENPWNDTITYLKRSFAEVEPLYILERDKTLTREEGKKLISERLTDAGAMLSALYAGAWSSSKPTEREVQAWVRYNNFAPESLPSYTADGSPAVPTPAPATK